MKIRRYIKNRLLDAWTDTIESDYMAGRINSEHGLQAVYYCKLRKSLPMDRGILVEPSLNINGQTVIPDIVITWKGRVVAVIELKYKPKGSPTFIKDVRNMALIASQREGLRLDHQRLVGVENLTVSYEMSPSILFVWAGIHRPERNQSDWLYSAEYPELADCFTEFHAETQPHGTPSIYHRY